MNDGISFHCTSCSYQTSIESLYDRHVAKHALVAPYLCPSCTYLDFDHGTFVDHMMTHQQGRVLRCSFCNYKSLPTSMRVHLLKHRTVDILDCSMCEFSTNYPNSMKQHVDGYHIREHICDFCQNVMSKYSLIKHAWNAHGVVIKSKLKSLNELGYGVDESESEAPIKSETYSDSDVKQEVPNIDDASVSSSKTTHEKYDGKWIGKFDCEYCDFTTKYFYSKKFHVEKFHIKLFTCGHCDSIMTKHQLAAHYKEAHGQDINLKHCRRFVEVSSDPHAAKTPENPSSAEVSGPSIVEAVKSASRRPRKKFGTDRPKKASSQPSTPDSGVPNSPAVPKIQETVEERSSSGCDQIPPFVLSIAEAVKSKTRKAKRKHSLVPSTKDFPRKYGNNENIDPTSVTTCSTSLGTQTREIGTSVEDDFVNQEMPYLEPEIPCASESRSEFLHCSTCQYKTRYKSVMRHHVVSHLPEDLLVCPKCKFSSHVSYEFARHLRSHSDGDSVSCCFCSHTVAIKAMGNLGLHLGTHRKLGTFFCSRCSYSSAVKQPLKDHFREHHSEKHRCPECPRVGTKFQILKHMTKSHPGVDSKLIYIPKANKTESGDVIINDKIDGNVVPGPDEGTPTCDAGNPNSDVGIDTASVGFPDPLDTAKRQTNPEDQLQSSNQQSSNQSSGLAASSTSKVNVKGPLYCSECPYNTKKKRLLRRHVAKHLLGVSFFRCPECSFKESNPYEFVLHLKSHEMNLMSCCFCSYGFRTAKGILRAYTSHLVMHRPVHFIDCPNCEKTFKRINELRSHFYTNHVVKRKCPDCNKSMTRYMLLRHTTKHTSSKKKPIHRSPIGSAPKMKDSQVNCMDPGTSDSTFIDGAVGESFGVPLSPLSPLSPESQNSGSPQKFPEPLNRNDPTTLVNTENQVNSATQPEDHMNPKYEPNSVEHCSETDFEDPTNVPIFDISEASLIRSGIEATQNVADSPNRKRKSAGLHTSVTKNPMFWDSTGFINILDFTRNSKDDESGAESDSEGTATGDEESNLGATTSSDGHIPYILDHNYAANPIIRRKKR